MKEYELGLTQKILARFNDCEDVMCRSIKVGDRVANILFILDITSYETISDFIIKPLQQIETFPSDESCAEYIVREVIQGREIKIAQDVEEVIEEVLKGKVCVLIEKEQTMILVDAAKFLTRAITEPPTSTVLQGPREGFNESVKNNISLIRRRLSTPDLVIKNTKIGRKTKTLVSLVYIDKVANKKMVKQIYDKLNQIDIDGVLDSHYVATYLQMYPNSIFKQVGTTEKPDIAVAKLLEGRVVVIVDGSPLALTLPFLVFENFQSSEDYYTNHHHASFVRWVRLIGILFAILLPGVFVALQLYHYSVIPIKFLVTIANTTQGIPFPPLIEMLFIVLLFELLNEASLRMPKYLGMAMSIVGALILGDTAVSAGLISPPTVMIVALSSMTTFTVADLSNQISILRLGMILMGALFGIFGIMLGVVWLISYMANLDSYGAPFLAPLTPFIKQDMKDFMRVDSRIDMNLNPQSFPNENKVRSSRLNIQTKNKQMMSNTLKQKEKSKRGKAENSHQFELKVKNPNNLKMHAKNSKKTIFKTQKAPKNGNLKQKDKEQFKPNNATKMQTKKNEATDINDIKKEDFMLVENENSDLNKKENE